jgi:hypothetical protein
MAKIGLIQDGNGCHNFYSVTAGVGPGKPNRREDTLLVQYFLHEIFKKHQVFNSNPFPSGTVAVDGIAGPQTFAAIKHFQTVLKSRGRSITQDGRVDPPVGEQAFGSITNSQYTIVWLNVGFQQARPQDWPHVSQASDCPGELRLVLREPKFVGTAG